MESTSTHRLCGRDGGSAGQKGWTYEKDGALWLNTTQLLKEKYLREGKSQEQVDKLDLKDDVLRRANGFYTYFAADIAYHRNKLEVRGFDKAINIWGADHHGHVARLQAALDGLGLDGSPPAGGGADAAGQPAAGRQAGADVQALRQGHRPPRPAGRDLSGRGPVFLQLRASTSPLDFDLDLAVREDSENPVYYVQYAHARICTLVARLAGRRGMRSPPQRRWSPAALQPGGAGPYQGPVPASGGDPLLARDYDPTRINRYLVSLAGDFHRFYNACRIKGGGPLACWPPG